MFDPNVPFDGEWRDLATGVDGMMDNPEWADGATDQPGIPDEPINTRLPAVPGYPWYEPQEDPYTLTPITISPNPAPWTPDEGSAESGMLPIVADYDPAYRTSGPIQAWGHEVSGGLSGDQAIGRIMRFPANIPERYDPYGVFNTDVRDDLSGAMAVSNMEYQDDAAVTTDLLQWPNVWGRY
jgi:hypothetical protein